METKGLNFYTFDICPYCKPVELLLQANNIEYNKHTLDLMKGDNRSEQYLKINPLGKVPALIDDGFIAFESNSIMRYICNSRNIADSWYPKDPKKRAIVDIYFDWHAQNIDNITKYTYSSIGYSSLPKDEAATVSNKGLFNLENIFLKKKFVASDENITIADLALAWHLNNLQYYGLEFTPRMKQYFNNVIEQLPGIRENFDAFDKLREEVLENMRKK
jgi:glutathione S-transferase